MTSKYEASTNDESGNPASLTAPLLVVTLVTTAMTAWLATVWWQGLLLGLVSGTSILVIAGKTKSTSPSDSAARVPTGPDPWSELGRSLSGLLTGVLPLWHGHIGVARNQAGQAIDELVVRFAGINEKLNSALGRVGGDAGERTVSYIASADTRLTAIVGSLEGALSAREELLTEISGLAQINTDLKKMASEVAAVANQIGRAHV